MGEFIHEYKEVSEMAEISATMPDELVEALDAASEATNQSRNDLIRQAVESYLEDLQDAALAMDRLNDEDDKFLDWEDVKRDLLSQERTPSPPAPLPEVEG